MKINLKQIGTIYSEFKIRENMPIQSKFSDKKAKVVLNNEYMEGLDNLSEFSHIILIYYFHKINEVKLKVKPFLLDEMKGVFATRAPVRPNPIGISIVKLDKIEGNTIYVDNVDILDGTPLLDVKPYVPVFDERQEAGNGWVEGLIDIDKSKSDNRFN